MRKKKLKIWNNSIRETKKSWMTLHIKVYCKEETYLRYTFFDGAKFV